MTTLFLRPSGKVEGLYSDMIPEFDLGPLSVKRASNVEFSDEHQRWVIEVDGRVIGSAVTRESALRLEAEVLNMRMEEN